MLLLETLSQYYEVIAKSANLACPTMHKPYVHLGDKLPHNILSLVICTSQSATFPHPRSTSAMLAKHRTLQLFSMEESQNVGCQLMTAV